LAAQWAKTELKIDQKFGLKDRDTALQKLKDASFKFDPSSPPPGGLVAFQAKFLSAAVFREMLKRTFNMKVNDKELAAIIDEFKHEEEATCIDCRYVCLFVCMYVLVFKWLLLYTGAVVVSLFTWSGALDC